MKARDLIDKHIDMNESSYNSAYLLSKMGYDDEDDWDSGETQSDQLIRDIVKVEQYAMRNVDRNLLSASTDKVFAELKSRFRFHDDVIWLGIGFARGGQKIIGGTDVPGGDFKGRDTLLTLSGIAGLTIPQAIRDLNYAR